MHMYPCTSSRLPNDFGLQASKQVLAAPKISSQAPSTCSNGGLQLATPSPHSVTPARTWIAAEQSHALVSATPGACTPQQQGPTSLKRAAEASNVLSTSRDEVLKARLGTKTTSAAAANEVAERFNWLSAPDSTDVRGRAKQHPEHDVRTIRVPAAVHRKLSASQKQYWDIKSRLMDAIVFIKIGTFYELYEDDAQIAHDLLGWKMTITGVGHCRQVGCPERGLLEAQTALVAAGHKVAVIEQLETAAQAKVRSPKNPLIARRVVDAIASQATALEPTGPESAQLLGLVAGGSEGNERLGFAVLDAASSRVRIGSVPVDTGDGSLRTLLAQTAPCEVLHVQAGLSTSALRVLKDPAAGWTRTALGKEDVPAPAAAEAALGARPELQAAARAVAALPGEHRPTEAVAALVGVLGHVKRMNLLDALDGCLQIMPYASGSSHMKLDGITMANLEVLAAQDGSRDGSLLQVLDCCTSHAGKRLLRAWLCRPLQSVAAIMRRQRAVQALGAAVAVCDELRSAMAAYPDLTRSVDRLKTAAAPSHDVLPLHLRQRAEQARLRAARTAIGGLSTHCRALRGAAAAYDSLVRAGECCESSLLQSLLSEAIAPEHAAAELLQNIQGMIVLSSEKDKKGAGGGNALLAISAAKWQPLQRAGSDVEARFAAEVEATTYVIDALQQHQETWQQLAIAFSTLDVLAAFAHFAASAEGPTCYPMFALAPDASAEPAPPVFEADGIWHPALTLSNGTAPVPNDICLGDADNSGAPGTEPALLLTGPNMGGKSTLLRTTCIAAIMAHLGAPVAARALTLSVVDAIFTRLGATDRIMSGESTFMVECNETASILQNATADSFVIFDELGRGTSTFDGYAIAHAVLEHMVAQRGCRVLFATHYHPLTTEFANSSNVQLAHMAATFKPSPKTGSEEIVFLYQLVSGACPRSYGLHVAALAGVPQPICQVAATVGDAFEMRIARIFRRSAGNQATRPASSVLVDSNDARDDEEALLLPLLLKTVHCDDADVLAAMTQLRRLLPALGI